MRSESHSRRRRSRADGPADIIVKGQPHQSGSPHTFAIRPVSSPPPPSSSSFLTCSYMAYLGFPEYLRDTMTQGRVNKESALGGRHNKVALISEVPSSHLTCSPSLHPCKHQRITDSQPEVQILLQDKCEKS